MTLARSAQRAHRPAWLGATRNINATGVDISTVTDHQTVNKGGDAKDHDSNLSNLVQMHPRSKFTKSAYESIRRTYVNHVVRPGPDRSLTSSSEAGGVQLAGRGKYLGLPFAYG